MAQAVVQARAQTFRVGAGTEIVARTSISRIATLTPQAAQVQPSATSFKGMPTASAQLVAGVPGAWKGVVQATLLRSLLIGGGLYVVGVRSPTQLGIGALAASSTLSLLQVASHAVRTR